MYYYKALYREPGSADLVYAKLRQQMPDLDMHIIDPVLSEHSNDLFHSTAFQDTELGGEVAFTMLAPLSTAAGASPSEFVNPQASVSPSPYGAAVAAILPDVENEKRTPPSKAVIYGYCDEEVKGALIQNLRRYGADSVMISKTPV